VIDLYTNILPTIGKGPQDTNTFLAMAKTLVDQGVTAIVATPMYKVNEIQNSIQSYVDKANERLQHSFIPLTILPGQQMVLQEGLVQALERNECITLNHSKKYMLLQLPNELSALAVESILYQLQLKGIVPIISEPERHRSFLENPDNLYELVQKGAIVQLSADSLIGRNGRKEKKAAVSFIGCGLAHVIASGVNVDTYEHYSLPKAYDCIARQFGNQILYKLMENADYIIEGKAVFKEQPERIKKGKFLGIL
jgi:protein-tyrosine phosphatase